ADVNAFRQAWQKVLGRHPALRTAFAWEGLKQPVQIVSREVKLTILDEDLRHLSVQQREARLQEHLSRQENSDLPLSQPPLLRITLFQLSDRTWWFLYSHHHLLVDGWSDFLLLKEVFAFYRAFSAGQDLSLPLPTPYREYIAWLQKKELAGAEIFWK